MTIDPDGTVFKVALHLLLRSVADLSEDIKTLCVIEPGEQVVYIG